MEEKLEMVETILYYLDKHEILTSIFRTCEKYKMKSTALNLFQFKMTIDPCLILEMNNLLGHQILFDPVSASKLIQEVVFQIIQEAQALPGLTEMAQILVSIRLKALPYIAEIFEVSCMSQRLSSGYVSINGVVTGCTAATQYTLSTRYICPLAFCEGSSGNHFIRIHLPGASENQTIRQDFICSFCGSLLEEDKKSRSLDERLIVEVIPEKAFLSTNLMNMDQNMHQATPICVRGDLTRAVDIGQSYTFIGLVHKVASFDKYSVSIEANNILKIQQNKKLNRNGVSSLPENLQNLYWDVCTLWNNHIIITLYTPDRCSSPWAFSHALAYLFGESISPTGTYFKLKMLLILSLLSLPANQKVLKQQKPLHVLALGNDDLIIHCLMSYAQKFASRCYPLTSLTALCGEVKQDKYVGSPYFVQGGSLLLASGGVCYVGDFNRLKKSCVEQIQTVLDTGKASIDVGAKFTGGLPHKLESDISCLLWGFSKPSNDKKQSSNDDLFQGCNTGSLSKSLLDCFGCVQFTDAPDSCNQEEVSEKCSRQSLANASLSIINKFSISFEDFEKFFKEARSWTPVLTNEVETLIQNYYKAIRKARNSQETCIAKCALHVLNSLCLSHARLNFHPTTQISDALIAIKLFEESITARFGYSLLCVQAVPHIPDHHEEEFLGTGLNSSMKTFEKNLTTFCASQETLEE